MFFPQRHGQRASKSAGKAGIWIPNASFNGLEETRDDEVDLKFSPPHTTPQFRLGLTGTAKGKGVDGAFAHEGRRHETGKKKQHEPAGRWVLACAKMSMFAPTKIGGTLFYCLSSVAPSWRDSCGGWNPSSCLGSILLKPNGLKWPTGHTNGDKPK